jgi:hypothetical protein
LEKHNPYRMLMIPLLRAIRYIINFWQNLQYRVKKCWLVYVIPLSVKRSYVYRPVTDYSLWITKAPYNTLYTQRLDHFVPKIPLPKVTACYTILVFANRIVYSKECSINTPSPLFTEEFSREIYEYV